MTATNPRRGRHSAQETIPPQNEVSGGPETPLELGGTGWKNTLKRTGKKFTRDRCSMTAGSLAYHWFLALFPALIALLGVASLVRIGGSGLHRLVNGLDQALPPGAATVFSQAVQSATTRSAASSLTVLIVGVVVAVWSASGGMAALETGLDIAYEVPVDRKFAGQAAVRVPAHAGHPHPRRHRRGADRVRAADRPGIEGHVGITGTAFTIAWTAVYWVMASSLITLLFSAYYFFGPNRRAPRWQWVSPGGLLGTAIFLLASLGFRFYVGSSARTARPTARSPEWRS